MNIESIFGILALAIGCWHEFTWFKRRDWSKVAGEVVDIVERKKRNKISFFPVIKYPNSQGEAEFKSKYGSSTKPRLSSETTVVVSPDESVAEQYSFSNRWLLTLIAFFISCIFLIKGFDLI